MGLKAKLQEKAGPAQPAKQKVVPFPARAECAAGAGIISQEALTERMLLKREITKSIAALKRHDEYLRQALVRGHSVERGVFDVTLNSKGRAVVR